jgi:hypothetical protein
MGDLTAALETVSLARRRAILFALETATEPADLVGLVWRNKSGRGLSTLASSIIQATPRHIKLPYVFWEEVEGGAVAPLFGLGHSFLEVSGGIPFVEYLKKYQGMLWIDPAADYDAFRQIRATNEERKR